MQRLWTEHSKNVLFKHQKLKKSSFIHSFPIKDTSGGGLKEFSKDILKTPSTN